jgi:hypothetical protein
MESKNLTNKVATLDAEIKTLRAQLTLLTELVEGVGLQPWLSPGEAAAFLGVSRDSIIRDIRQAEKLRFADRKGDFQFGIHYRQKRAGATVPRWQVNVFEWRKIMGIAPEQRVG